MVKYAFQLTATPTNISNAFKNAGIWTYDATVFTDEYFAPSFVTDRPMPHSQPLQEINNLPGPSNIREKSPEDLHESNFTVCNVEPSPSIIQPSPQQRQCSVEYINATRSSGIQQSMKVDCGNEPGPSGLQLESRQYSPELISPHYHSQTADRITFQIEGNDAASLSPELIRPLPKAPPRLIGVNTQRKRKSAVLTYTPEKNALAEEQAKKRKEV
ncbi:unnamed protein product [Parnassius apollo]|uniref:(apollo) hypothetical protein n=1 Tax=Parnassius apollo TaxID=110799 RepID=A0A8S3YD23_PARAO|nr:unnamed protein product [Parnassius apollo]